MSKFQGNLEDIQRLHPRYCYFLKSIYCLSLNGFVITTAVNTKFDEYRINDQVVIPHLNRFAELKEFHGIDDEKPSNGADGPQKMASGLLCKSFTFRFRS